MLSSFVKIARHPQARLVIVALIVVSLVVLPGLAFAAPTTLPYEDGLKTFRTSMKGPVPFAISLVGIVACGAMLIFGGEISGFMRTMIFIILVVAVIVQASNVVELLGGTNPDAGTAAYAIGVDAMRGVG